MLSKSQIQFISSLGINKYRRINLKFIAEGTKIVHELLQSNFIPDTLFATEDWIQENMLGIDKEIRIIQVTENELKKISTLKTPNRVLAVVNVPASPKEIPDVNSFLFLMLDNINDPGNMGTIIRTADWFGIPNIICSENCVDVYNPKVVQASMGSIFRVGIRYENLNDFLQNLKDDVPIYGTLLEGNNLYETDIRNNGIIIIGNESHGISAHLLPYIKSKIRIPAYSQNQTFPAESLNASVATAIVLAEFRRRFPMEK
jgi:TrmH family RNA methyltransferase